MYLLEAEIRVYSAETSRGPLSLTGTDVVAALTVCSFADTYLIGEPNSTAKLFIRENCF